MYVDYIDGGLRVPNISTTFKALKLLTNGIKVQTNLGQPFQIIILRHTADSTSYFLKQIEIPLFYKEILLHMWELKQLYGYNQGQNCVIFNNKEILIQGKTFYDNKWHQHGVLSIQDLLNNKGKFLSYQEFLEKYDLDCNFLRYLQVLAEDS